MNRIGSQGGKKDVSFVMANRTVVAQKHRIRDRPGRQVFAVDEVVFAERCDLAFLGARTLEGLNLVVNPTEKKLVAAGPIPAA